MKNGAIFWTRIFPLYFTAPVKQFQKWCQKNPVRLSTVGASCEAAYSATKSGIHGLTRALAKELAPSNIQVNAIACGAIETSMNAQLSAEEKSAFEEEIPAGRFGTPQEVADLVWNLVNSPSYLTGQIIGLDGGYI